MHHVFPEGININFARVDAPARSIEYRCYERGICKETLSCGTGALAVAYVADRLGFSKDQTVAVWPHRCRWYQSSSRIVVQKGKGGWVLRGRPQMLFSGKYLLEEKNQPQRWIHRNERMMVA
jgi:diaminopimelate epimerase